MSTPLLRSGRGWRPFGLAVLIMLVSAAVALAATIYVGPVLSRWSNAVGGSCLAYSSGYTDYSQVRWGRAGGSCTNTLDTNKSGYAFDGVTPGDVPSATSFLLGKFSHNNFPVSSGTSISQVNLDLQVPVCGQTLTFNYTFKHDETTNTGDDRRVCAYGPALTLYNPYVYYPASPGWPGGSRYPNVSGDTGPNRFGCADRVTLPTALPATTFTCNSEELTIILTAFLPSADGTCPATPGSSTTNYFYTTETVRSDACVYAQIIAPSSVFLADFGAAQGDNAIKVTWQTASELENRGFNLWRGTSPDGPDIKLNETLIPSQSQGLPGGGFEYAWEDSRDLVGDTTYWYWIEDLSTNGVLTRHEPVSLTYSAPEAGPTAVTLQGMRASSTSDLALGMLAALAVLTLGGAAARRRN